VVDGVDFINDKVWFGSSTTISGDNFFYTTKIAVVPFLKATLYAMKKGPYKRVASL
jgi:hypothetical protein